MTTVIIRKTSTDAYESFTCIGHAEYAKFFWAGQKDVVCSAISAIVINTINSLEELTFAKMDVTTNAKTGFIQCKFLHPLNEQQILLMNSMVLGLQKIQEEYTTKYLEVRFEEV